MSIQSDSAYPVFKVPYRLFEKKEAVPFELVNQANNLIHFAIFDYEKYRDETNESNEVALFSIDNSADDMRAAKTTLPSTTKNLYLVKAYIGFDSMSFIIQKASHAKTLNFEIDEQGGFWEFKHNATYHELTYQQADSLLNLDGQKR